MEALVTLLGWLRCCLEGFPDKRRRNNTQYSMVDIGMSALSESIGGEEMRKSNFALRLKPSLLVEARKVAESEGVALNQVHQRGGGRESLGPADGELFRGTRGASRHSQGARHPFPCGQR